MTVSTVESMTFLPCATQADIRHGIIAPPAPPECEQIGNDAQSTGVLHLDRSVVWEDGPRGVQAVVSDLEQAQAALDDQNEQLQLLDQRITVLQGDIQKADAKKGHLKFARLTCCPASHLLAIAIHRATEHYALPTGSI